MINIKNTKKKLTFFFVGMIFLLILIFSVSSIFTKYIGGYKISEKNFTNFVSRFEKSEKKIIDFYKNRNILKKINKDLDKEKRLGGANFGGKSNFINTIFLKDTEIIFMDVKDNVSVDFINKILQDDKFFEVSTLKSFFVKKIEIGNGVSIFFEKIDYDFSEFLEDILLFLAIDLFFCIVIYFIGRKFIDEVFEPVEDNLEDMKNFVHNAGHELKTPISVMDSNIQLFNDMKSYDEKMVTEMKRELKNMNNLIDSLIKLSNIGSFRSKEKISLKSLIDEILKSKNLELKEKNISTKTDILDNVFIQANRGYLNIFISNIIGNAIRYNKKDGKIEIIYKKGTLKIIDSGAGVSEENLEKIFDRFFKVDTSRNSEGFGIGLSLVKKIADIYSWKISVKSEEKKGSEFWVRF